MILLLLLLALLPTILFVIYIYAKDSYEKEPKGLLAGLFFLGVASIIPAVILEVINGMINTALFEDYFYVYTFVEAFIVVAVAEEGFKFLFAFIVTWKNHNFNYKFDGIVYCVLTSLGFATLENIMYVFGNENALGVAITRAILSVPGHAMFGVYMGYHYGNAKFFATIGNKKSKRVEMFLTLLIPILLHGTFDFCLMTEDGIFILLFFIFVVVLDILAFIRIHNSSKSNSRIFKTPQYGQFYRFNNINAGYGNQPMYGVPPMANQAPPMYGAPPMVNQTPPVYGVPPMVNQAPPVYGAPPMVNQAPSMNGVTPMVNQAPPLYGVPPMQQPNMAPFSNCLNCGAIVASNMLVCSRCGCPVRR